MQTNEKKESKCKENPEFIGWGITDRCNLSCPHCYSSAKKSSVGEFSTEECYKILDQLIDLGVKTIGWTGGEPLLRADLELLISYAADRGGILSGLTTNGVYLDEKRARSLKKAGVGSIQISLDGSTPERNWQMRRATDEDFHKVINAIQVGIEQDFKIHLAMLLSEDNLDDVRDYIELARNMKVESIRFCCFVPSGRGAAEKIQKKLLFNKKLPELKRLTEEMVWADNPVIMFDPGFGPLPSEYYFHECIAGIRTFYIAANGDVYPCTSLLNKKFVVGNLRELTLYDIWNDPAMTGITSIPQDKITGPCRDCDYFANCRGACRGIAFAHSGDLYASFPNCLSRIRKAEIGIGQTHSIPNKNT